MGQLMDRYDPALVSLMVPGLVADPQRRTGWWTVITRRTKLQLVVFVLITVIGVAYVGARYARLDRFFVDDAYEVVAHFADSGGAFAGAEVSYRGVRVGRVDELVLTDAGVDLHLEIDNDHDDIPADTLAVVGNRSAVGEQYVELQPQVDDGPYLREGTEIAQDDTRIPLSTTTLLTNLSNTVESVGEDDLRTVVSEFGTAFQGTGQNLGRIIDTSNAFIESANASFETTTKLIRDANTVLRGQIASGDSLRVFARDFQKFSGTLVLADKDLRTVIDNGSATATELRTFLEDNQVELSELINNLVTTGEVVVRRLDGVEQILAIYPYVVEGGFTVAAKTPATGLYDAHFGMVLTNEPHGLPRRLRGHRHPRPAGRQQPADERGRPLHRAGHAVQRPRRPARPAAGAGRLRRGPHAGRSWRRTTPRPAS